MDLAEKLEILADSAKYDVACTSSGVDRPGRHGALGSSAAAGICHAFTADGRCVSLLKVLYSNVCSYDCSYCVNRRSNDRPRATFTPRELAELTIGFYRRNYIEGLFLSSAVLGTPDRTMELMIEALRILREEYHFNGYIHAKTIPGADPMLVEKIGRLADRLSVNIELPSETSLTTLAPDKKKTAILRPMGQIAVQSAQSKKEMVLYRGAKPFAPAGQSTQMIIGATPETDRHIMDLTEGLYRKYSLKRVFYSAYLPVVEDRRLPALHTAPPLLREHRLYQADWLLRYYHFSARELLTEDEPIIRLFAADPAVVDLGVRFLRTISLFYLMPAATNGIQGFFRGMGDLKVTLNSSMLNMGGRVAAAALLVLVLKMDIEALPFSYAVGWLLMLLYELPLLVRFLRSSEM